MNRDEVYIISKDEGTMLHKYSILGMDDKEKDDLVSGFLTALNSFAAHIGFPSGISLIRSGPLEARFTSGEFIFTVLIINYQTTLGVIAEPIINGLASEITKTFEQKYHSALKEGRKHRMYKTDDFNNFRGDIDKIINKFGAETFELYQKLIIIEAMYENVPIEALYEKEPLIERVSNGENIMKELEPIINIYLKMRRAIEKVN